MDDLAVVMVTWNVRDWALRALRSLFAALERSELAASVWVVDNASGDGTPEAIRSAFPMVRLIVNSTNRGFAAANNQALKAMGYPDRSAAPRYVWLLNPDTEVLDEAPRILLRFMEATPRAGVCGPRLIYPDGRFQHSAFDFPGLAQLFLDLFPLHPRLLETRLNGRYPRAWYARGKPFRIGHPLGAAMMVRGEAIRLVGLLDEGYWIYAEEVDWCWRMARAGWERYCVPEAVVAHASGESARQARPEMIRALWASRLRLYRQHYPRWKFRLACRLVAMGASWRAQALARAVDPGSAAMRAAYEEVRRMAFQAEEL
ncbi:glycosyltransferase family 2 protein [Thermoflexus sp.]|uniref:glycosyltransferase family 2 protein n=1 Tax=Thermoflexus sp. TaxID=1969742 RepID=UPI0026311762|nr:glycosyltransferase family 2 protein [Thermoflexus sp.]MCX7691683.1 glycosyltransferase family 2 protein [Thermoflexus sp.]MDW8065742.1 glycosyltransferase family 2 protein [Anaerolineae bacterium]